MISFHNCKLFHFAETAATESSMNHPGLSFHNFQAGDMQSTELIYKDISFILLGHLLPVRWEDYSDGC